MSRSARAGRIGAAVLAGGAIAATFVGVPTADSATTETATETVNVRSGPSTERDVVGSLQRGERITALSTSAKGWTKVRFGSRTAYVASRYLTTQTSVPETASAKGAGTRYATAELNVRVGPGLGQRVVGRIAEGGSVTLTGASSKGFSQITYAGARRWVSSQYVALSRESVAAKTSTRTATADLDVRATPAKRTTVITTVRRGTRLEVTGATSGNFAQILFRGQTRWVTARYLGNVSANLPAVPASYANNSSKGAIALAYAKRQVGKPYVFGAEGPNSFDCSGLTQTAWKQVGISLPRLSYDQIRVGTRISKSDLRPGDLVYFYRGRAHVALYAGNGMVLHAPRPGKVVQYIKMSYMPFNGASRPG